MVKITFSNYLCSLIPLMSFYSATMFRKIRKHDNNWHHFRGIFESLDYLQLSMLICDLAYVSVAVDNVVITMFNV